MSTLTTKCWGENYGVRANWAEASSQVLTLDDDGKWQSTGKQVADYRHDKYAALRDALEQIAAISAGDNDETAAIDRAMERVVETE